MKRLTRILILSIVSLLFGISAVACMHEHTYSSVYSKNAQKHWKDSTCEHVLVTEESAHTFDGGVVGNNNTTITYTCTVCGYKNVQGHNHTFGDWQVETEATVVQEGLKVKPCTALGCTEKQTQVIEKIQAVSLSVFTQPTKLTYELGETFDPTGMVIFAYGIDASLNNVTDYVTYELEPLTLSNNSVTVSFGDLNIEIEVSVGHECSFDGEWLELIAPTILNEGVKYKVCSISGCDRTIEDSIERIAVKSIKVTTQPTKLVYNLNDTFDSTGMIVTAIGIDDSTEEVTSLCTVENDVLTLLNNKVTITYGAFSTEVSVTVNHVHDFEEATWVTETPATILAEGSKYRVCIISGCEERDYGVIEKVEVESIAITTPANKLVYNLGETFDATGMVVTATGVDSSTADVTSLCTIESDELTLLNNKVTVTYGTFSLEVNVTVNHTCVLATEWTVETPATILAEGLKVKGCTVDGCNEREEEVIPKVEVESIAITTPATKLVYTLGETFDATGMVVTATGVDSSTADITALCTIEADELTLLNNKVTVTYGSFTLEVSVIVNHTCVHVQWTIDTPATILTEGAKYSICSVDGCEERADEVIPVVEVASIEIATQPTTLEYGIYEVFDATGMIVTAIGADESTADVTSLVEISYDTFAEAGTAIVTVSYGGKTAEVEVTVINNVVSVAEALSKQVGEKATINGYVVGYANLDQRVRNSETVFTESYILIKDKNSDVIINVRYEYAKLRTDELSGWDASRPYDKGDEVVLAGVITADANGNQNFLELGANNPAKKDTIKSKANVIDYNLINAVKVTNQTEWEETFTSDLAPMTIIRITGSVWGGRYCVDTSATGRPATRCTVLSMNTAPTEMPKSDGKIVNISDGPMNLNTDINGNWRGSLPISLTNSTANWSTIVSTYSGVKALDMYVMYVGSNDKFYELVVLDSCWLDASHEHTSDAEAVEVNGHNSYVCADCGVSYLEHVFAEEWTVIKPTFASEGLRYKECTIDGCYRRIEEVLAKVETTSIEVATAPTKVQYGLLEEFDATGMVVKAIGEGAEAEVTELATIQVGRFTEVGEYTVKVSYAGFETEFTVTVIDNALTVAQALEQEVGAEVRVKGYFVGVTNFNQDDRLADGTYTNTYLLVKDTASDKIIAIRYEFAKFVVKGSNSDPWDITALNYTKGDLVIIDGVITAGEYNENLIYLDYNDNKNADTILSSGNEVSYSFENAVVLDEWADWETAFTDIKPMTYIRITGTLYGARSNSSYGVHAETDLQARNRTRETRIYMNSEASKWGETQVTGKFVTLIDNVMNANLGSGWSSEIPYTGAAASASWGASRITSKTVDMYVLYTGSSHSYYYNNRPDGVATGSSVANLGHHQVVVLDYSWFDAASLTA